MILAWLIILLMTGGILSWIISPYNKNAPRWISLLFVAVTFVLSLGIWFGSGTPVDIAEAGEGWIKELILPWIPQFGISFHLAMDGLSLILVILTLFLGVISVLVSWSKVQEKVGFYYFNLLWILAGIVGVFLAMDLFLFYFFWEVMLIPMYLLIGIWGYEKRIYAAYKFFIFTQASGLLMLLSILGLYFIHGAETGNYTFNYMELLGTNMSSDVSMLLMLGFLIAFVVKLPGFPFHNWLPDAHTQAPTAGSLIMAGVLLKTGAYGILRFVLPMFPESAVAFAPIAMILGVIGILYGAKLAFAQTDLKRLVAYSSVSHMGFIMIGAFAFNEWATKGVIIQMIAHGISTGALFMLVGVLQERIHTRDIRDMGGLWTKVPWMGGVGVVFAMASLGLPGLGNFIAEFLILVGTFQVNVWAAVFAALGLVFSSIYSLRILQTVFYGEPKKEWELSDLNVRESVMFGAMIGVIVWVGLYPQPILDTVNQPVQGILGNFQEAQIEEPVEMTEDTKEALLFDDALQIYNQLPNKQD